MYFTHDIITDTYQFGDDTCKTKWYFTPEAAKEEYLKIRVLPEVRKVEFNVVEELV